VHGYAHRRGEIRVLLLAVVFNLNLLREERGRAWTELGTYQHVGWRQVVGTLSMT
jgi:hypothetical protein